MKYQIKPLLAGLVVAGLLVAAGLPAQERRDGKGDRGTVIRDKGPSRRAAKTRRYFGKITDVNTERLLLTMHDRVKGKRLDTRDRKTTVKPRDLPGRKMVFQVSRSARITFDGKRATLKDLKEGMHARVTAQPAGAEEGRRTEGNDARRDTKDAGARGKDSRVTDRPGNWVQPMAIRIEANSKVKRKKG
jgi:hypothetical protein